MEKNRGFIKTILIIVIALAALKYFLNWSVFDAMESEKGKETLEYVRNIINTLWSYLEKPAMYVWNEAARPLIDMILSRVTKQEQ